MKLYNVVNLIVKLCVFGVLVVYCDYFGLSYEDVVMVLLKLFCGKVLVFVDSVVFFD